ncbi:MAG TPA: DUF2946 domain-containing protein [Burkholderiaceae bacterium]|nr:DUF2946 domain-containing protein [Burkholderiaceae bacterium]
MSHRRRLHHRIGWAALLALLLATLAPSVAHALRHARGDTLPWSQLCSASGGTRVVFESQPGEPGSTPHAHAFEQCGFCALHSQGWAPAPAVGALALRGDLHATLPLAQPLPVQTRRAWLAAQPRAPPLLR